MDNDSMDWTETSPLQTYTPPKCEIHSTEFLNAPRSSLKRPFAEVSDGTEPVDRNHYITSEDYAAAEHVVPQAVPAPWYAPVAKGLQWTALAIYVVGAVTTVVAMQASRCKSLVSCYTYSLYASQKKSLIFQIPGHRITLLEHL